MEISKGGMEMNMKTKGFIVVLFAAVVLMAGAFAMAGSAEPSSSAPSVTDENGKVTVEGTATIYGNWACNGEASVEATPGEALEPVSGFPGGVQSTMVTVSVHGLECGDGTMNKHLRKALKEKDHPEITFHTDKYTLENGGGEVKAFGELTIAGVTKPIELDAQLTPLPEGGVRVVGKVDIEMKDYSVKPPSLIFGTLKVANDVSVKFDTVIQPPQEVAQVTSSVENQ
jgi:hypothetical protein